MTFWQWSGEHPWLFLLACVTACGETEGAPMTPYDVALFLFLALVTGCAFIVGRVLPTELKQCQFCGRWPNTGRGP